MSSCVHSPRDGYALLRELASRSGMPIGVHVQIADRCNHSCQHCYQVQGQKGELEFAELTAILDDLADAGVLMLNLSGGEATLRPDLLPLLAHARDRGFAVRLYTNAYAIDDVMADGIAAAQVLEVHTSVYSDRPEEHDAVTRVPGSLERTLEGVGRLRARKVRVVLKMPLLNAAPDAHARVSRLAAELGCSLQASADITPVEDGSLAPKALETPPADLIRQGLLTGWSPSSDDDRLRQEKLASGPCGVCKNSITMLSNGEVRPCTDTVVPLGNLRHKRLRDLYQSSPEVAFFQSLTWSDVHGCRDCDLLLSCSRCHAAAVLEQGDYLGPYASACARARARYEALAGPLSLLDPDPECPPARDPALGPYRIESLGVLRPIPHRTSERDEEQASRFAWLRPKRGYFSELIGGACTPASAAENLVSLRKNRSRAD